MPVTAPTSSAMVTTRMARLRLIFQLVMMLGIEAGSISLVKNCQSVGRNDFIMSRSSLEVLCMLSSVSTKKIGPQVTTSTNRILNSTERNQRMAKRIQEMTGTAIKSRTTGVK